MANYIDGFRAGLEDCAKEAERMAVFMRNKGFLAAAKEAGENEHDAKIAAESAANVYAIFAQVIRSKIANANAMAEAAKRVRQGSR